MLITYSCIKLGRLDQVWMNLMSAGIFARSVLEEQQHCHQEKNRLHFHIISGNNSSKTVTVGQVLIFFGPKQNNR